MKHNVKTQNVRICKKGEHYYYYDQILQRCSLDIILKAVTLMLLMESTKFLSAVVVEQYYVMWWIESFFLYYASLCILLFGKKKKERNCKKRVKLVFKLGFVKIYAREIIRTISIIPFILKSLTLKYYTQTVNRTINRTSVLINKKVSNFDS